VKRCSPVLVLPGVLCLAAAGALAGAQATEKAMQAVQSWLQLVDAGRYRRSYKDAANYFQSRIAESKWIARVKPIRQPLGAVISRRLQTAQYTTSLPGAPDGQYVVMAFDTSFQNKKSAVETVTAMLDRGRWRVCGYFIR